MTVEVCPDGCFCERCVNPDPAILVAIVTMAAHPVVMAEIRAALIHIHDVPEADLPVTDPGLFQEWVVRVVDNAGDNEHEIVAAFDG